MIMDSKFRERLEQRKQELIGARTSGSPVVQEASNEERIAARFDSAMYEFKQKAKMVFFGAAAFSLMLNFVMVREWWSFIGSPEFSQYKQRIERVK